MKNHCNDSGSNPYLPGRFHAEANGVFILWEVKSTSHNWMDGLKNSPFILTCNASSDKLYYT